MTLNFSLNIGLWNAWIPLLVFNAFTYIYSYILDKEGFKRGGDYVKAPKDKVITQGIYRLSRNPIYLVTYLVSISTIFMTLSWILAISLILSVISTHFMILLEEDYLAKKYGNDYIEYKQEVPRYILFF